MKTVTILLAAIAVLVWAVPANASGVLYGTGFEATTPPPPSFTEGGTVDGIDGWYLKYGDYVTQSAGSINGTMSMYGAKTTRNTGIQRFTNTTEDIVVFTTKAKLATKGDGSASNHLYLWTYAGPWNAAGWGKIAATVVFGGDGKIYASYGAQEEVLKDANGVDLEYNANQVYDVRMLTFYDAVARTGTYDIYIDDVLYLEGKSWYYNNIDRLQGISVDTYNVSTTVDDMSFIGIDPGDATFNGVVDLADLQILSDNWGSGDSWDTGDFSKDDNVDLADLQLLSDNWGTSAGSSGMIPEPATLSLLILGGLGLVRRRNRRN